jgi:hypothetical protein
VFPVAEITGAISAVIAGVSLMLDEAERSTDPERRTDELHAVLVRLHGRLSDWQKAASLTNSRAHDWRAGLPGSAGAASVMIFPQILRQTAAGRGVARIMRERIYELRTERRMLRRSVDTDETDVTLRKLLEVHAPDAASSIDQVLYRRGEILRDLPDELERRYRDGGEPAVDAYLSDMDDSLIQIAGSMDELAEFVRERFPLGDA